MTRIYTRIGDNKTTRLFDGSEVLKTHPRVEACGALDELNSHLGVVRALTPGGEIDPTLELVQSLLFELGASLGDPNSATDRITDEDVAWVEREIDTAMDECSPLTAFILPTGTAVSAQLHVARTVCRRAERAIVGLSETCTVSSSALRFLNRLSDLLFALARLANERAGTGDVEWRARNAR